MSGWDLVESGDGGFVVDIVSPGLVGNFAAQVTSAGDPLDGLSREINPGSNACHIGALVAGSQGTSVILRVLDSSGTLIGADEYTFTGSEGSSVPLGVGNGQSYFPQTDTRVELLYSGSTTTASVTFDELHIAYCV